MEKENYEQPEYNPDTDIVLDEVKVDEMNDVYKVRQNDSKKYRILMVAPRFSPKHGGGGVVITSQLSKALADRGHEVTIYTSDFEKDDDFLKEHWNKGIDVFSAHSAFNIGTFHFTFDMIKRCKEDFRNKDFDIVHLQSYRSFQNMIVCHYARKYGIPYILEAHGMTPGFGSPIVRFQKWIIDIVFGKKLLRHSSKCLAETRTGVQEYVDYNVDRHKVKEIIPPRDLSEFDNLPPEGEFKQKFGITEPNIILFLGGIDHIKGVDFLVKSFIELCKNRNDTKLVIAGADFGLKKELDEMISKANLTDKVLYTGFISGKDKLAMIVDANMMVMPSRKEQGLPFSGLESLMCLTPLIVADGTGSADDVRNMNGGGFIVKFDDVEGLTKLMNLILDDPEKSGSWSALIGKNYVEENFSMKTRIADYEKIYHDVINKIPIDIQEWQDLCWEEEIYGSPRF